MRSQTRFSLHTAKKYQSLQTLCLFFTFIPLFFNFAAGSIVEKYHPHQDYRENHQVQPNQIQALSSFSELQSTPQRFEKHLGRKNPVKIKIQPFSQKSPSQDSKLFFGASTELPSLNPLRISNSKSRSLASVCEDPNCLDCYFNVSTQQCLTCQAGFALNQSGICQISSIQNCLRQQVAQNGFTVCAECQQGFQLTENQLGCGYSCGSSKVENCKICHQNSSCMECQNSYILQDGFCFPYYADNCRSSEKVGNQIRFHCTQCFQGYALNPIYDICEACQVANCSSCKYNLLQLCDSCQAGFFRQNSSLCGKCLQNCNQCLSTDNCSVCQPGYILYESMLCGTCPIESCKQCQLRGAQRVCTLCFDNLTYILIQNSCLKRNASYSREGQVAFGNYRFKCQTGCKRCESTADFSICTQCQEGYAMNYSYTCQKCRENCRTCAEDSLQTCTSCYNGYYLNSSSLACQKCMFKYCLNCTTDKQSCEACVISYFFAGNQFGCQPCSQNCAQCEDEQTCIQCQMGYFVQTFKDTELVGCVTCVGNCADCRGFEECTSCFPGFFLELTTATCRSCEENCWNCFSDTNCTECLPGYQLSERSCVRGIKNCAILNSKDSSKCQQCYLGYFQNEDSSSCQYKSYVSEEGRRFACEQSQAYLYNFDCYACQIQFENCQACHGPYCLKCSSGYYISNTALGCLPCAIQNCLSCLNSEVCEVCLEGFYIPLGPESQKGGSCSACSKNCKTCSQRKDICTSCVQGLILNQNVRCVGGLTLGIQLLLNKEFDTIADYLPGIRKVVANFIQDETLNSTDKEKNCHVKKVKKGSSRVGFQLTFANQQQHSKAQSQARQTLMEGNSINGIEVLEVSVFNYSTAKKAVQPTATTSISIGIIIGVVGAVILIGAVVGVIFYYKKRRNISLNQNLEQVEKFSKTTMGGPETEENMNSEKEIGKTQVKSKLDPTIKWVDPTNYL